jgi:tRNA pseudouridine38-40 synthase
MRFRATVAYDGTAYLGFQRQASDAPTIQRALERAIAAVTQPPVTVIGAGRTDTGVHALGQVIAFDVEWRHGDDALLHAINANLPDDIALQDIAQQPGFHPRFDASSRVYVYQLIQSPHRQPLLRYRAWHVRGELDGEAMQVAAEKLLGRHDFAAFGRPPQGENTVRMVFQSQWTHEPSACGVKWAYRIEADAFLQHMVRRIVGTLVDVGRGLMTPAQFEAVIKSANLAESGTLAPPHGLMLIEVKYQNANGQ